MSGTTVEWIAMLLLFVLLAGVIIAEVRWLVRKGWATSGLAIGYVMLTDLLAFCVGGFMAFALLGVLLMMIFGPAGTGSTAPEASYWVVTAIAVILPPVILFALKRLFLLIFKIKSGKTAWLYSLVSSILIILIVLIPPPLFLYVVVTLWKL
jgi:hypothetical protein